MKWNRAGRLTRARLLRALVILPAAYLVAACTGKPDSAGGSPASRATRSSSAASGTPRASRDATATTGAAGAPVLQATPECVDADDVTLAQTEGPYFTRNSPERTSLLEPGMPGTRLVLTGYVLTTACQPVAGALLDFWQADDAGQYDNRGYRLRGHQFSDDAGRYQLETVMPGLYPGRTRHLHMKVQAPNQRVLTTQTYFPGEARNRSDGTYRPELVMDVQEAADGSAATFNFVLDMR